MAKYLLLKHYRGGPAPPALEFEGMVKVFFADGGTLEQLRATLASIAETAEMRLDELDEKVDELQRDDVAFAQRAHLNSLGLRFIVAHERAIATWARWALRETGSWRSTTDPGAWDHRQVFGTEATPSSA